MDGQNVRGRGLMPSCFIHVEPAQVRLGELGTLRIPRRAVERSAVMGCISGSWDGPNLGPSSICWLHHEVEPDAASSEYPCEIAIVVIMVPIWG